MQRISKTQVAGFFLGGAAIGAAAALLFAPKTGVQTRKELRRFSRRAMNQLEDLQCGIRDQITESVAQVKRMIKTA